MGKPRFPPPSSNSRLSSAPRSIATSRVSGYEPVRRLSSVPAWGSRFRHRSSFTNCPRPSRCRQYGAIATPSSTTRSSWWIRVPDRSSPHRVVVDDEAGDEILIVARRYAVAQLDADHLVAGALRAVPRTVLGRERVATIFRGKLRAGIERHLHGGGVRLNEHVGDLDLVAQIRPVAAVV